MCLELADNDGDGFCRDRKAKPDRAAVRREDNRSDSKDGSVYRQQRAAGVTTIDRGISLEEINVRVVFQSAAARGDDAGRDRLAKSEGIADGYDGVAYQGLVRGSQL